MIDNVDLMVIVADRIDPFKLAFQVQKKLSEREVALDLAVNRQAAFEEAANKPTLQSMVKGKGVKFAFVGQFPRFVSILM